MTDDRFASPEFWAASTYAEMAHPFTSRFAENAWALARVRAGARVLDVATGAGALALIAARNGAHVLATDFSEGMVRRVEAAGEPNIEARRMDGQALDLPDDSFDAAFSMFSVFMFPDWRAGLREMARVLRPGGIGCVGTWNDEAGAATSLLISRLYRELFPHVALPDPPPSMKILSVPESLAAEMQTAGFAAVSVTAVSHDFILEAPALDAGNNLFSFSPVWDKLSSDEQGRLLDKARTMLDPDGVIRVPSTALIAIGTKPQFT